MSKSWRDHDRHSKACQVRQDIPGAIRHLSAAIELARISEPAQVALMLNRLAKLYLESGELTSAATVAQESIQMELEFGELTASKRYIASYYMMLATIREKQERFSEALDLAESGIEAFQQAGSESHEFMENLLRYRNALKQNAWRG